MIFQRPINNKAKRKNVKIATYLYIGVFWNQIFKIRNYAYKNFDTKNWDFYTN